MSFKESSVGAGVGVGLGVVGTAEGVVGSVGAPGVGTVGFIGSSTIIETHPLSLFTIT